MKTIRVYRLTNLSKSQFSRLKGAQQEAAQVWNLCMELHKAARTAHTQWPSRDALQKATKGRMALWEYGKDDYLTHKAKQAHILSFTGSERGTSSRCPRCGHKQKPNSRNWVCRACGFTGHRDLVGSANMHLLAYGMHVEFPRSFTYLRPGPTRQRSSRADTPPSCLSESAGQARLGEPVSSETAHPVDVAQKPVS